MGGNGKRPASGGLSVAEVLDGKNLCLIGSTGFVGKVALSMLLCRYPNVGKVFALVRPGMGNTAEDRFFKKVAASPAFDPLREMWRGGYDDFLREKVVPIPGDIGRPRCNFTDTELTAFEAAGGLEVIINSAGLVSFEPSLESALRINALGAKNCLEAARAAGAALVHVSTCFVAGRRNGEVWEDEPVVGYFPRKDELRDDDFDAEAEIADCQAVIDQVRARANDRKHISHFRERAAAALEEQRRDPDDPKILRLAVARERKIWVHQQLTTLGVERAHHWGWTNTYTYTKSLGEQIILADKEVRSTIVRPAIVESALRFPFPGWNEGFNTTAPLVYLCLKGHRQIVTGDKTALDIIPVDQVCAALISATAALLAGEAEPIYQACSSDSNPVSAARLAELTGLVVRNHRRELADAGEEPVANRIRARLEAFPVTRRRFERTSAPIFKKIADRAIDVIDERLPRWGAPRLTAIAERARDELQNISDFTGQVKDLMEMFQPFTHDYDIVFRADNMRALHARLSVADQQALPWDPDSIDWRRYWFDVHFPGLKKWTFPILDDEFGKKPRSVYTHKDLLEMFNAATKLHRHRVAMRLLAADDDEPVVYTYERVQDMAEQAAAQLRERGVVPGDRVALMSENRPEWGISYFGILRAGAAAVPLDAQLSLAEVQNLLAASGARVAVFSERVADRLLEDEGVEVVIGDGSVAGLASELADRGTAAEILAFDQLLDEPAVSPGAIAAGVKGDDVASLIFTSGTTGRPKGVMLTHKNFTSMASKLSAMFNLYRHDGLLSVLPLHHTFEFSAGLLMPLMHGAQITYIEVVDADNLERAFASGHVTGLVGVPALWQLLHRKITKQVNERGEVIKRLFDGLIDLNSAIRDRSPFGIDLGKLLFFPIHRALGGRMRLLISGGSALPVEVMKAFRGFGFRIFEGYGMTEAAPVITVQRPGDKLLLGSVGRALPGIDVKIADPDGGGVGEVIARGPNVMKGYFENPEATEETLAEGWLHTGDLGRLDEDGNLYIVGRKKEMILGSSGENIYPDELEELYGESEHIKEISVVGLRSGVGDAETVAALVVPEYDSGDGLDRSEVKERVREHIKETSHKLPLYKRLRIYHLWDHDLPKTSTRKIKRREVIRELERLEQVSNPAAASAAKGDGEGGILELVARVAQRPLAEVRREARLDSLGFDSLMITELAVALEEAGISLPDASELGNLETVAELEAFCRQRRRAQRRVAPAESSVPRNGETSGEIAVPAPLVQVGRGVLEAGQRALYSRLLESRVTGRAYVPPFGGYIVAANHASHLDMGLVKHALGENGSRLVALAAKDYFFDDPIRRTYFENFTNLVPMERHGSLRESLRLAAQVIEDGYILLIFPEGTRSVSGVMTDFKPSLGYLARRTGCGILPMFLAGTHEALPKGGWWLGSREVGAHIGPFLDPTALDAIAAPGGEKCPRAESYRRISNHAEGIVRRLCPADQEWALGEAGRRAVADMTEARS
jgi:long-chain acyl-CoA synthetase